MNSLYQSDFKKEASAIAKLSPQLFQAFSRFNKEVFKEKELSTKFKEIIAVAVANVTGCPYCIEAHTHAAKKLNVKKEALLEAIAVAASIKGGSALLHGINTLDAYTQESQLLYHKPNLSSLLLEFEELNQEYSFIEHKERIFDSGELTKKEKKLIALAIAHVTGDPYSIHLLSEQAKQEQIRYEEILEAVFVATALKAGSALAHRYNSYQAYMSEE